MIVYVTGMHSSGTSLTSNYLHHCGVNMMEGVPVDFLAEDRKFRIISHRILKDSGLHRYSPTFNHEHLHPTEITVSKMKSQIQNAVDLASGSHWGWKAPINSLCIWKWLPLLRSKVNKERVVILLVVRHPFEVIKSFYRRKSRKDIHYITNVNGGKPYLNLEGVWFAYNKSVLDFVDTHEGYDFFVVETESMIQTPDLLTSELGLEEIPIKQVLNKERFIGEQKHPFQMGRSKLLWDTLMEKRLQ